MLRRFNLLIGESSLNRKKKQSEYPLTNLSMNSNKRLQFRLVSHSSSSSVSDSDIINCNRLFWLRNNSTEAINMWNICKSVGFSYSGEEQDIIQRINDLEERDNNRRGNKEGNNNNDK